MILLTGFRGTSSELLVKKAGCKSIILPNDKKMDAWLLTEEMARRRYDYVFSFGQKPNIKDKLYMETTARNMAACIHTNFACDRLKNVFEANGLSTRISGNAGTSFCNALYWSGLSYIYEKGIDTRMILLHIPFCKNIADSEKFFERILAVVENMRVWQPNT